jgi:[1-hydroxy-2-(trimethylamino)ethyl]phosphonate dioxygenase
MTMHADSSSVLATIERLYTAHGTLVYGEQVNQIQHAMQCASLAQASGSTDAMVAAAMLHDIGHMLHGDAATALDTGEDDRHESLGADWLARWFGDDVVQPVALHVQAKRYLCARDPGYLEGLSRVSTRTLHLQGGPMQPAEAEAFERLPHARNAIDLRRWDDLGKKAGCETAPLSHFMTVIERCLLPA